MLAADSLVARDKMLLGQAGAGEGKAEAGEGTAVEAEAGADDCDEAGESRCTKSNALVAGPLMEISSPWNCTARQIVSSLSDDGPSLLIHSVSSDPVKRNNPGIGWMRSSCWVSQKSKSPGTHRTARDKSKRGA